MLKVTNFRYIKPIFNTTKSPYEFKIAIENR